MTPSLSTRDLERMADAILRGDAVRLGASTHDVQDAAEIAVERLREQIGDREQDLRIGRGQRNELRALLREAYTALSADPRYDELARQIKAVSFSVEYVPADDFRGDR